MAFYIRKSFTIGPVRLNLSKSGLGGSVGTKGARSGRSHRPGAGRSLSLMSSSLITSLRATPPPTPRLV
jgi:hypothetical protein